MLVAIAIPVFTQQLEKAREGTDLSNIRSAYAEAAFVVLNGTTNAHTSSVTGGAITPTADANGNITSVTIASFPIAQTVGGWIIDTSNVAGYKSLGADWQPTKGNEPLQSSLLLAQMVS